ncbi:sterol desaturase family protein [Fictibacillus nanhaiensis]|uniref:Sterol desaturase family protein n=1 Tax=Fictibacillus nanhaiensis TaxID=742169 RepID=A0ABS2ZRQ1_9BACL|nr:sterol desaturase family protein [Fictibacillus nanhaiensis]
MKSKGIYGDFFLHMDILIMMVIFIVMNSYLFTTDITINVLSFFPLGILIYMFSEYFTHRFFFHIKAPKNTFLFKLIKRLHYDHHRKPNELKLLFLPVWYSAPSLFFLSTLLYLITRSVPYTLSFASGLLFMFFIYEWKHYVAHRPLKPKTRFGRWIKKTHTLHHYKNENYWYGVSTPFIDVLFGTLKDEKEVEWSATAKHLEDR